MLSHKVGTVLHATAEILSELSPISKKVADTVDLILLLVNNFFESINGKRLKAVKSSGVLQHGHTC